MINELNLIRALTTDLHLPEPAVQWLVSLYNAAQVFDDVADNGQILRHNLNRAIWDTLVAMPQNEFFLQHGAYLLPVLGVNIIKWQTADIEERNGRVNAKTYMWRAGFFDIVLQVVQLCHGVDSAMHLAPMVLKMYAEEFNDYLKEFIHA